MGPALGKNELLMFNTVFKPLGPIFRTREWFQRILHCPADAAADAALLRVLQKCCIDCFVRCPAGAAVDAALLECPQKCCAGCCARWQRAQQPMQHF